MGTGKISVELMLAPFTKSLAEDYAKRTAARIGTCSTLPDPADVKCTMTCPMSEIHELPPGQTSPRLFVAVPMAIGSPDLVGFLKVIVDVQCAALAFFEVVVADGSSEYKGVVLQYLLTDKAKEAYTNFNSRGFHTIYCKHRNPTGRYSLQFMDLDFPPLQPPDDAGSHGQEDQVLFRSGLTLSKLRTFVSYFAGDDITIRKFSNPTNPSVPPGVVHVIMQHTEDAVAPVFYHMKKPELFAHNQSFSRMLTTVHRVAMVLGVTNCDAPDSADDALSPVSPYHSETIPIARQASPVPTYPPLPTSKLPSSQIGRNMPKSPAGTEPSSPLIPMSTISSNSPTRGDSAALPRTTLSDKSDLLSKLPMSTIPLEESTAGRGASPADKEDYLLHVVAKLQGVAGNAEKVLETLQQPEVRKALTVKPGEAASAFYPAFTQLVIPHLDELMKTPETCYVCEFIVKHERAFPASAAALEVLLARVKNVFAHLLSGDPCHLSLLTTIVTELAATTDCVVFWELFGDDHSFHRAIQTPSGSATIAALLPTFTLPNHQKAICNLISSQLESLLDGATSGRLRIVSAAVAADMVQIERVAEVVSARLVELCKRKHSTKLVLTLLRTGYTAVIDHITDQLCVPSILDKLCRKERGFGRRVVEACITAAGMPQLVALHGALLQHKWIQLQITTAPVVALVKQRIAAEEERLKEIEGATALALPPPKEDSDEEEPGEGDEKMLDQMELPFPPLPPNWTHHISFTFGHFFFVNLEVERLTGGVQGDLFLSFEHPVTHKLYRATLQQMVASKYLRDREVYDLCNASGFTVDEFRAWCNDPRIPAPMIVKAMRDFLSLPSQEVLEARIKHKLLPRLAESAEGKEDKEGAGGATPSHLPAALQALPASQLSFHDIGALPPSRVGNPLLSHSLYPARFT